MTTQVSRASLFLVLGLCAGTSLAEALDGASDSHWWSETNDLFSYRIQGLLYGIQRDLQRSLLNQNNILNISNHQRTGELRLDLNLKLSELEVSAKPRFNLTWEHWNQGLHAGESHTEDDSYINEGGVGYHLRDDLVGFYGRQNLQWGPSFLLSPSNPFNPRNGQNNPWLEIPGLDYGKLTWVPSSHWSTQIIANTGEGHLDLYRDFRRTYAGKIDFTGTGHYASMILSHRESGPSLLGYYGGLTLSDAALLHLEGNVDNSGNNQTLFGGSYTFSNGATLAAEYYRNSSGCLRKEIGYCFAPFDDTNPDLSLYRRDYGLLQYFHAGFIDPALDLTLRGIINLDDGSSRSIAMLNYDLNNYIEFFTLADWASGSPSSELGTIYKYSIMIGTSISY
jgi:hypothetical protein